MSSSRVSRPAGGAHIFPFLAVLICTMGALVVLLVVISQHARQAGMAEGSNRHRAAPTPAMAAKAAKLEAELHDARAKIQRRLSEHQLQLGHLEDHLRRLRGRLDPLKASIRDLQQSESQNSEQAAVTAAQLEKLKRQIFDAQTELRDAAQKARSRPVSYSVVPYTGPNQTRRRPIYIECVEDSVVLQPEGILFTAADFEGPLGPGNPLASAARAVREYWMLRLPADASQRVEPYPLLLVRPKGVLAYYAARAALQSWSNEFGYELIAEDWDVTYPPEDRELSRLLSLVVNDARERQAELIAAAPRRYRRSHGGFVATPHRGGFVQRRGSSEGGSPYAGGGSGLGSGGTEFGGGESEFGGSGSAAGADKSAGGFGGHAGAGGGPGDDSILGGIGGAGSRGPVGATTGSASEKQLTAQSSSGSSSSGASQAGAPGSQKNKGKQPVRFGEYVPPRDKPRRHAPHVDSDSFNGSSESDVARTPESKSRRRAADRRRDNWGLPDASHGAIAVSRPVVIECRPDKLIIIPDDARAAAVQVPLAERTEDSVEDLVSSLWKHMNGWGLAGKGLYWRPKLLVRVAPDGQRRYEDLCALLKDSGFEIEAAAVPATAQQTSPSRR